MCADLTSVLVISVTLTYQPYATTGSPIKTAFSFAVEVVLSEIMKHLIISCCTFCCHSLQVKSCPVATKRFLIHTALRDTGTGFVLFQHAVCCNQTELMNLSTPPPPAIFSSPFMRWPGVLNLFYGIHSYF